jgi:L-ascorbate metabolism protein UlaG (beta-lactamase superfamily)
MSLSLEFIGLACFRVWAPGTPVVVLDPYTPSEIGLPDRKIAGDVILASSFTDAAHFNPKLVEGSPEAVNALDIAEGQEFQLDGSPVVAVPATEDPARKDAPRDCAMHALSLGGLGLVHMGDVGYVPSEAELEPFRARCDVLLLLAGILFTPPLEELDRMIGFLEPDWIIPMHYYLPGMLFAFETVDRFVAHRQHDVVVYPRSTTVTLPFEGPSDRVPKIVVLEAAALG